MIELISAPKSQVADDLGALFSLPSFATRTVAKAFSPLANALCSRATKVLDAACQSKAACETLILSTSAACGFTATMGGAIMGLSTNLQETFVAAAVLACSAFSAYAVFRGTENYAKVQQALCVPSS